MRKSDVEGKRKELSEGVCGEGEHQALQKL